MKPNRLSTKKHTLRFAVILSALILAGCASTQSTTSSTSVSSASSTVSTASTSEESGADETDSTGGAMNGTIGSVIEANLSFKNKDFYIDYSTEDTVKIDLSAPKEADGVKVSGSTVTITEAGMYVLSGTLTDGQVIIDAGDEDDVRLVLENASITCTTTAPIYAKNADKVIISLPENTESTVTDTITGTDGDDELTAAVFAKCDLSVNGTGVLNVNSNANDGITSEDKLKITGGVLNITSADDGLIGKDAVLIKDGTVHITASGNGIKSTKSEADKGYVYIGGGTVNITAEQDGIQAETGVLHFRGRSKCHRRRRQREWRAKNGQCYVWRRTEYNGGRNPVYKGHQGRSRARHHRRHRHGRFRRRQPAQQRFDDRFRRRYHRKVRRRRPARR